jgi:DNA-binding Lrp family transcriptional regulator
MIEDFVRNPNITWVASCDGNWDLYLVIWSKNVFQFNKTFTEINNKYSFYFSRKSIIANTKVLQFMRKYLASKKEDISYKTVVWAGEISNVSLDKIDFKILATISQDARLSDSEIGKKIGISRKIVTYRIRKMINSGVIYGFKPFLNGDLLNFKTYKILLTLQSLTSDKETGLVNFLNHHPNVIEVIHCIGNWEMELDVESLGIEENHDLIRRLKNEFTHVIRECEPLLIYKTYKYDYLPKKLVQLKIRK